MDVALVKRQTCETDVNSKHVLFKGERSNALAGHTSTGRWWTATSGEVGMDCPLLRLVKNLILKGSPYPAKRHQCSGWSHG